MDTPNLRTRRHSINHGCPGFFSRGPRFEKAFEFIETSKVAINQTCVQNDDPVTDDDEVMFIPPIAGG
jgi:molybdopterin converting factor small subunit